MTFCSKDTILVEKGHCIEELEPSVTKNPAISTLVANSRKMVKVIKEQMCPLYPGALNRMCSKFGEDWMNMQDWE